jgi:hypothetical protein
MHLPFRKQDLENHSSHDTQKKCERNSVELKLSAEHKIGRMPAVAPISIFNAGSKVT